MKYPSPRYILVAFISLFAITGLCACDQSPSVTQTPGHNSDTTQPTELSAKEVKLGYFANLTHAQAVLGVESGDFQKALGSTKLTTRVFNAGPELIQGLNAGEVDIGYVGPGPAISAFANSHGQSLRVIGGAAANGVVIVARKDSGIHTMADLKGKAIATPSHGNTQDVSARHYVTATLGQPDDTNVKGIPNAEQAGAFARGQIDAAWVPEPWGARLISEAGAVLIGQEKDLWPSQEFSLTVVVTTPKFLAEHPDVVQKILEVHHQWTVRLREHPDQYESELNTALAALAGKPLPANVLHDAVSRTEFTDDALADTFATMAKWSADLKVINTVPNLSTLFETTIIKKISQNAAAAKP